MADYSYIAQPQVPDSFKTIGSMLNIARGVVDLTKAKETLQSDISKAKSESERTQIETGVARDTAPARVTQQTELAKQAETKSNLDRFKLTGDYLTKTRDISRGLVNDPDVISGNADAIIPKISAARQAMIDFGVPPAIAEVQASHLMTEAAKNPKGLRQILLNSINADVGAAGTATNIQEGGVPVTNNATSSVVATRPLAATPVGQTVPGTQQTLQVPVTQREEASINPVTRSPMVTEKDAQGRVIDVRQAPTSAGVPQLAPGGPEDIPILTNLRAGVNSAAAKVPETRFNNSQIIKLADETNTGKGAEIMRNLKGGYAALPWTADTAKNFDTLGHFIALESVNHAKAMNAGTDAARTLAEQANTSTGWTREAIKTAAKVNDALATGLDFFNRGMEAAVQKSGGNILAVRPFQNAWSQAFDPNVYRYANAVQAGDKAEITKILGPEGSQQRQAKALELAKKSAVLHRLATEGK